MKIKNIYIGRWPGGLHFHVQPDNTEFPVKKFENCEDAIEYALQFVSREHIFIKEIKTLHRNYDGD